MIDFASLFKLTQSGSCSLNDSLSHAYRIIAKGASGGLGSGGVGSSRGALVVSVLELHKDEEIYILVGQRGEHACIKSMGYRDKGCESKGGRNSFDKSANSKIGQLKNLVIEDGAGGGGGGTFVYLLNAANAAVPLLIAGGAGGLGIGRYLDDDLQQHGRGYEPERLDVSGQRHGEMNRTGGPGGGWRADDDTLLGTYSGASLLEGNGLLHSHSFFRSLNNQMVSGGRGGEPCYSARGIYGQGGFGGGGGGCSTGGKRFVSLFKLKLHVKIIS